MKNTASQSDIDQVNSEPFDLTRNVNYLLRRAHARADQLFDGAMADLGLTPRQAALLYGVKICEGGSISALTIFTGMDRGTVSEMVPRLISRRLLERRPAKEDGRAMALYLTELGSELVDAATERTAALQAKVLATLPSEYRDLFMKMLLLMVGLEVQTRIKIDPNNRADSE
ncbi:MULTISPECIES: MarR family winged helix-turn-helix transcriptional regulator [unclassified Beijerinckia]|uniref:MarR family winged helix-turn-helix transcriptional regulator n=1 Tax=unclassified Beijerinckia TaxID=2638183 RepID=UPI0008967129|nr:MULTISPECIES: MarR family winged helix-turn-helix transcriptional regulator [unclassified Beijerinckia]MDH7799204.1 DNA-binding MarR family transcriptional regulator [Beijerinckia sp. GAS462]SED92069.1 transcriptional regulator, MarR family [Beijerinckia sp. 28-YEA-48]